MAKGILAADESTGTIKKRFDTIDTESNENNRRTYREMLFQSEGMKDNIGGVILFDETIKQNAADGSSLVSVILKQGCASWN
jgi:fructose-bisphosphate aldolase class I